MWITNYRTYKHETKGRHIRVLQPVTGQKPPIKIPLDKNPPRIIEEIIAKYAVDANLFRLGSTNPKEKSNPWFFLGFYTGGLLSGGFCPGYFCPGAFGREDKYLKLWNQGDLKNEIWKYFQIIMIGTYHFLYHFFSEQSIKLSGR